MKRVLILTPRLDVTFKQGPVPKERGPVPVIRLPWVDIALRISNEHNNRGDNVEVIELPLWQFTPELVREKTPDIVYVPHKESHNFPLDGIDARYYMQTVFPWRFYIDPKGFAGGSTLYPMDISNGDEHGPHFDKFRKYVLLGKSKFEQPTDHFDLSTIGINPFEYVFFACQIPHDETIKHHSDITVEQALEETCRVTEGLKYPLVVKGHPVNPGSMKNLINICDKYSHVVWLENVSIHDLIPNALAVVTVNSGTGMESLFHLRPVITFGRAEYDIATMKADLSGNLYYFLENPIYDIHLAKKFIDSWCKKTYDTSLPSDFTKLKL